MTSKYTTTHTFEPDGVTPRFPGKELCVCGLPEDSGLHFQKDLTPSTMNQLTKEAEQRVKTKLNQILLGNDNQIEYDLETCTEEMLKLFKDEIDRAMEKERAKLWLIKKIIGIPDKE